MPYKIRDRHGVGETLGRGNLVNGPLLRSRFWKVSIVFPDLERDTSRHSGLIVREVDVIDQERRSLTDGCDP